MPMFTYVIEHHSGAQRLMTVEAETKEEALMVVHAELYKFWDELEGEE